MTNTPRTDELVHQLSQANYGESKMERACRVENPLMALCRDLEMRLGNAISKIADAQQTIEHLNNRIKTLEHHLKVEQGEVQKLRGHNGAGRWL